MKFSIENSMKNVMKNYMKFFMKIFMENPWNSMEFHEIFHGISWEKLHEKKSLNVYEKFCGIPWICMEFSMKFHGIPRNFMKLRLMEFHGIPWKIPWN
jgi:hypothetical protein